MNGANRSQRSFFANWRKSPLCDKRESIFRRGLKIVSFRFQHPNDYECDDATRTGRDAACVRERNECSQISKVSRSGENAMNFMCRRELHFLCFVLFSVSRIFCKKFLFFHRHNYTYNLLIDFCVASCAGGIKQKYENNLSKQIQHQQQKRDKIYNRSTTFIKILQVDVAAFIV